jgi:AraC-like DNA-binding protein/uncharacterized cupin superfamily protein
MAHDIIEISKEISPKDEQIEFHSHFFYEIIFVLDGTCHYIIEDKEYQVGKGNIILIPPGIKHQVNWTNDKRLYERYVLWINKDFLEQQKLVDRDILYAFEKCQKNNNYVLKSTTSSSYQSLEQDLIQLVNGSNEEKLNKEIWSVSLGLSFIVHLNRTHYDLETKNISDYKDILLGDMLAYIDTHLNEKISIADLAQVLHVSPSTISRLCKQKLNVSLHQFIIQRRLKIAKSNILAGIDISEAWENLGFTDYSAFFRAFKRYYGVSPTRFKKENL